MPAESPAASSPHHVAQHRGSPPTGSIVGNRDRVECLTCDDSSPFLTSPVVCCRARWQRF